MIVLCNDYSRGKHEEDNSPVLTLRWWNTWPFMCDLQSLEISFIHYACCRWRRKAARLQLWCVQTVCCWLQPRHPWLFTATVWNFENMLMVIPTCTSESLLVFCWRYLMAHLSLCSTCLVPSGTHQLTKVNFVAFGVWFISSAVSQYFLNQPVLCNMQPSDFSLVFHWIYIWCCCCWTICHFRQRFFTVVFHTWQVCKVC